ncbi:hypothetical protein [Bradyrhizobium lablabi]|uniref:hypothetical protein n=1 Tax=Bradyrhizobium lablabi TaxID=722472 RepID=UPI001BAA5934|nr:hypothetical protein [Bradyrhizobium lablabi]MBR0697772.1 hypothetical protein [Bradyrhizobium lablabi]
MKRRRVKSLKVQGATPTKQSLNARYAEIVRLRRAILLMQARIDMASRQDRTASK